jgi:hypothetical protein
MIEEKRLSEIKNAKSQVVNGQLTIWNERLGLLLRAGKLSDLIQHLGSPVSDVVNNCGCNVQCGSIPDAIGEVASNVKG